jgi:hypothetical protein
MGRFHRQEPVRTALTVATTGACGAFQEIAKAYPSLRSG